MGYEYYFLRPGNKTIFEFGKDRTGFPFLLRGWQEIPKPLPEDLGEILLQAAEEWGSWEDDSLNLEVMQRIADKLYAWADGQPVLLVGEGRLELPDIETDNACRKAGKWVRQYKVKLYTLTGSRY